MDNTTVNLSTMVDGNGSFNNRTDNDIYAIHNPAQITIDRYVTPIIYVIGFPGNILAFFIWIGKRMRHSSGCYLAALAISDMMFLMLQLLFELSTVWNTPVLDLPVVCEVYTMLYLSVQYYSPLLVLGFTVERFISMCHPFLREKLCTTKRALIVIVCLYGFAFALCSIQGYFWMYDNETKTCNIRPGVTVGGTASLWAVWTWITEILIFVCVPVMVLGFNVMVIIEARKLTREESLRTPGGQTRENAATTLMLLAVSFYVIFTTLPVTVIYLVYFSFQQGDTDTSDDDIRADPTWQRHFPYMLLRIIIQEIGLTHYAFKFYIYCITSKPFRDELCRMFRHLCCKSASVVLVSQLLGRTTSVTNGQSRGSST